MRIIKRNIMNKIHLRTVAAIFSMTAIVFLFGGNIPVMAAPAWDPPILTWLSDGESRNPNSGNQQTIKVTNVKEENRLSLSYYDKLYYPGGNIDTGGWGDYNDTGGIAIFENMPDGWVEGKSRWLYWVIFGGWITTDFSAFSPRINMDCTPPPSPSRQFPVNNTEFFIGPSDTSKTIQFSWINPVDDASGMDYVKILFNNNSDSEFDVDVNLSGALQFKDFIVPPGNHVWEMQAFDEAQGLDTVNGNNRNYSGWTSEWTVTVTVDNTGPSGSIGIENGATYTTSASVTLTLSATDSQSGVSKMQFSNDNSTWSSEENYSTSKTWTLTSAMAAKQSM